MSSSEERPEEGRPPQVRVTVRGDRVDIAITGAQAPPPEQPRGLAGPLPDFLAEAGWRYFSPAAEEVVLLLLAGRPLSEGEVARRLGGDEQYAAWLLADLAERNVLVPTPQGFALNCSAEPEAREAVLALIAPPEPPALPERPRPEDHKPTLALPERPDRPREAQ